ncbi:MAG: sulfatase-like hydrolase/transferase [Bacteroidales bacterium]
MKNKLYILLKIYLGFICVFAIQKPLFMLYHYNLYGGSSISEWMNVIYHGLPLDLSMAGYLTVIPVIMTLLSVWKQGVWFGKALNAYFMIINLVIAVIFVSDLELYSYWGFRLDSTPLFYLKSPANAAASVPVLMMFIMPLMMMLVWYLLNKLMKRIVAGGVESSFPEKKRIIYSFGLLLVLGILFIPIRGGFSVSTMNVGKVYHSTNMLLNHAAINPMFSLMTSLTKEGEFGSQYRFMDNQEAEQVFVSLLDKHTSVAEDSLLTMERPNVIMIVLESFSGKIIEPLGGLPNVAPTMNRLYQEGIGFTNFYANSFRTDRGLVSILSGYPAQPSTSIMKYPAKTQSLPSISGSLKKEGYDLEFIYGGDADFTNMRSYFISAGFDKITADKDFPVSDRLSKWGVNDEKTFRYLSEAIKKQSAQPFMKMFLTLSSHEPFDVPTHRFDDPYLNSVAYTDSCLGVFIDELKASPLWDNTLVVLLPDHAMHYPATISISEPARYHIPMIWTGGAIRTPRPIEVYGSQIDLAATLLRQMNLPYDDFVFSKDMMNATNRPFAYYTFKDGFGILKDSSIFVYDCASNQSIIHQTRVANELEKEGKAFLQCLYNDLDKR